MYNPSAKEPPTAPVPGSAAPPYYPPQGPPPPYTAQPGFTPMFVPTTGGAAPSPAPIGVPPTPMVNVHVIQSRMGPFPMQVTCGKCGAQVMTTTQTRPGLLTFLLSGALVVLGCWLGCCLIPCCIPECQDVDHKCPNCNASLGTFTRL